MDLPVVWTMVDVLLFFSSVVELYVPNDSEKVKFRYQFVLVIVWLYLTEQRG